VTTSILPAQREDSPLLRNLFQFYYYDMNELLGGPVGPGGLFSPPPLDAYWEDSWRHPFLLRVDGHPAGFALVHRRSRITGDPTIWDVAEFFVMRQYRHKGAGTELALHVFERFRGRWEVRQFPANVAATKFWRGVIAQHMSGAFEDAVSDDERWRGIVQRFDNASLPPR
jgi:predicted acetyltransferase